MTAIAAADRIGVFDAVLLVGLLGAWALLSIAWAYGNERKLERLERRRGIGPRVGSALGLLCVGGIWLPLAVGDWRAVGELTLTLGLLPVLGGGYYLAGAVANARAYLAMRRREPTPIADLDGGLAEVQGTARPSDAGTVTAPFSRAETLCYLASVEERTPEYEAASSGRGSLAASAVGSLPVVAVDDRRRPFVLEDDTGRIEVAVEDADLRLDPTEVLEVPEDEEAPGDVLTGLEERTDLVDVDRDRRYVEERLDPGDEVYVLGRAVGTSGEGRGTDDGERRIEPPEGTPELLIAPGCESTVRSEFRRAVVGGAVAGVGLLAVGSLVLARAAGAI